MRKLTILLGVPAVFSIPAYAVVITDDFSGATLSPTWLLDDQVESYYTEPVGGVNPGFKMQPESGTARFDLVGNNAYAHLRSASTYDSSGGLRADAILRQDHYPVQTWGIGIGIYFDNNNYVALKQSAAGGASGWLRHMNVNGSFSQQLGSAVSDLRQYWLIGGIELTDTQIKFYGSPIAPKQDKYGVTDIDANVSLINELTIARPASFTGNATVLIGKGFNAPGYNNPHWDNSVASDWYDFAGVDYARISVVGGTPGWAVNASGDWNVGSNWSGGIPNAVDATANFGTIITSAQTVYTNVPVTVGTLSFNNASTYQVAGNGSLTLDVSTGAAQVNVRQGSHKINLPLIFNDNTTITVASGGTLVIGNPATIKAGKNVSKTGNVLIQAPLTIEAGGTLTLAGPGAAAVFGAPALAPGAAVNVQNNTLTIDYRGQATPASTVRSQLTTGYAGGLWNGPGINTSSAIQGQTGLGWNDAPASESITVKYTYYGDVNLTGTVDSLDYNAFIAGYGLTAAANWAQGDFNYDQKVNTLDFNFLAGNFGKTPIPSPALGAVVPEPTVLAVLPLFVLSLRRRHG